MILLLALGSYAVEAVWIWPDYLAYFNAFAGGPSNGYRHLVDSSLDWGQDLPGLRRWLDEHRLNDSKKAYFSYFGRDDIEYRGILACQLPSDNPVNRVYFQPWRGGVYAVSATILSGLSIEPQGGWCRADEEAYRAMQSKMETLELLRTAPQRQELMAKVPFQELTNSYFRFRRMRMSRLCAYLRHRKPDEQVGHSILIYRLSDEQVAQALTGTVELDPDLIRVHRAP